MPKVIIPEAVAPDTPSAGNVALYAKTDGLLYSKDDAGVETSLNGVIDGDKGDITVASSGTVWTIDPLAITTAKLNDSAITTAKITDANVTTDKLADGAITTVKIADANVTNAKLANGYINDLTTVTIASGDALAIADVSDSGNKKKALVSDILKIAPTFSAYASVSQGVVSGTATRVNLGTESFDTNNNFTSNRFTPTVAGYYSLTGQVRGSATNLTAVAALLYVNGTSYRQGGTINTAAATTTQTVSVSDIIFLNGTTDYVELYGVVSGTSPEFQTVSSAQTSFLSGVLVRL